MGREAERRAAEIRIRAERKTGSLLKDSTKTGRPEKRSPDTTLSDMGISKDQSSKWQKLGSANIAFQALDFKGSKTPKKTIP